MNRQMYIRVIIIAILTCLGGFSTQWEGIATLLTPEAHAEVLTPRRTDMVEALRPSSWHFSQDRFQVCDCLRCHKPERCSGSLSVI
jgi:hypothetical protein